MYEINLYSRSVLTQRLGHVVTETMVNFLSTAGVGMAHLNMYWIILLNRHISLVMKTGQADSLIIKTNFNYL